MALTHHGSVPKTKCPVSPLRLPNRLTDIFSTLLKSEDSGRFILLVLLGYITSGQLRVPKDVPEQCS